MSQFTTYHCTVCHRTLERSAVKAFYRKMERAHRFDDIQLRCSCGGEVDVIPDPRVTIFVGQQNESHRDNVSIHVFDEHDAYVETGLLPPSKFSLQKSGAEWTWGYAGTGPTSLAHALLAYVYDEQIADRYHQQFKWTVVAGWDQRSFAITNDQIVAWLDQFEADVAWTRQNGKSEEL